MTAILVTGGAGYIGSHTCVELIKYGYDVCILDSLVNSSEKTISNIRKIISKNNQLNYGKLFFKKGDLRDEKLLDNIFMEFEEKNRKFSAVIHFAGLKSVEESVKQPLKYWIVNLNSTLSLLSSMNRFECNTLVFSSSATIYDPNVEGRFKEENPRKPINPYGETKLAIEKILENLFISDTKKWKIANLRYFNPVGAHESGMIGENPINSPNNLFPIVLKVARGEYEYLSIFGNDWPTKDGTCIRDYIHVMDLADAHLAALNFLSSNKPQIIPFNIGTGHGTSVKEIVEKFMEINKVSIPYRFLPRRKGDIAYSVADNSLAKKILNWAPQKDIYDMCKDGWKWKSLNPEGYQ